MSLLREKEKKDSCIHSWNWIVLLVGYNTSELSLAFGKTKVHCIAAPLVAAAVYTGSIKTPTVLKSIQKTTNSLLKYKVCYFLNS